MTDTKAGHCVKCGAGWREYTGCEMPDCEWKEDNALTVAICGAKPMPEDDATGCAHTNLDSGFGLAGGGYGVYMYCKDCGFITSKTQTD
jgi:hypothetical protein